MPPTYERMMGGRRGHSGNARESLPQNARGAQADRGAAGYACLRIFAKATKQSTICTTTKKKYTGNRAMATA